MFSFLTFPLPVFVAIENNLFEEQGITFEQKQFEQTKDLLNAIVSSNVDASLGGINLLDFVLVNQRSGGKIKLLSATVLDKEHRVSCLVSINYTNLTELSGKRIGHIAGAFGVAWAKAPFDSLGIDSSGFVPIENNLLLTSLEAGSVDAVYLIEPGCVKAESLEYNVVIDEPIANYFANNAYFTASVASSSLSLEKREKMVLIYNAAVDFIRANPTKAKEILAKYTKLKPELANTLAIPRFLKSTEISDSELRRSIEILQTKSLVNGSVDISQVVFN